MVPLQLCRAQYNEVKLGDYTSVGLAADASQHASGRETPLLLTPWTNWIFALDPNDVGMTQQWYNASWRVVGNWSRIGTMDGWGSATALRAWASENPKKHFDGAGWFRYTFAGEELEQKKDAMSSFDGVTFALALSAACGSLTGWVNGAPLKVSGDPVRLGTSLLLEIPQRAVNLNGPNVVALRFEDKGSKTCADADGAGLRGRVFVVGKPATENGALHDGKFVTAAAGITSSLPTNSGSSWKFDSEQYERFAAARRDGRFSIGLAAPWNSPGADSPPDSPPAPPGLAPAWRSGPPPPLTPPSFDARVRWPGAIHAIRDQKQCDSCWAFATAESLSDRLAIASVREF